MLVVISPAKKLNFEKNTTYPDFSIPEFVDDSAKLINILKKSKKEDIKKLMRLSDNLTNLNYTRYQEWDKKHTLSNSKQAVFAFQGDVYVGLQADELTSDELNFAQKNLRILSGLYGVLKPLDLINPYRLEMGTRVKNEKGRTLYDFWGQKITKHINKEGQNIVVNLASEEYFKSINLETLKPKVVSIVFKDYKNGEFKIISFYAKRARGLMSRYIIKNKIEEIEDLKLFNYGGYSFDQKSSNDNKLVFLRKKVI